MKTFVLRNNEESAQQKTNYFWLYNSEEELWEPIRKQKEIKTA